MMKKYYTISKNLSILKYVILLKLYEIKRKFILWLVKNYTKCKNCCRGGQIDQRLIILMRNMHRKIPLGFYSQGYPVRNGG